MHYDKQIHRRCKFHIQSLQLSRVVYDVSNPCMWCKVINNISNYNNYYTFVSCSDHGNDQRGVKSVKPLCDEGTVTWYGPYGALRVELQYSRPGEYKACFVVESINTRLQVFRESWSNSKFSSSYKLPSTASLKPVTDVYGKSREFCMTSSTPVVLYLESVRTQEMSGLPHVTIQYLLENRNYIAEVDPLEGWYTCTSQLYYLYVL